MQYFLAKTEPKVYSVHDLKRDGTTCWDGVRNPQALQAIQAMKPKDRVFIYHSGGDSQVAGLAEVTSDPKPDPKIPKSFTVELRYLLTLDSPTTLGEIKQDPRFAGWSLVRQSRLSTMAVPAEFVAWMRERYPNAGI